MPAKGAAQSATWKERCSTAVEQYVRFARSLRVFKTFCLYASNVLWGMCATVLGTTIVHMELLFETNTATMSWTFTAYALGYLLGAVICGLIYDRVNHELAFSVGNFLSAGSLMIAPFVGNVWPFVGVMSIEAVAEGFTGTSSQSYSVSLWDGHRAKEPTVMAMHVSWSLGAAIGPLIIGAFLVELPRSSDVVNWTSSLSAITSSPSLPDNQTVNAGGLTLDGIASDAYVRMRNTYITSEPNSSIPLFNNTLQHGRVLPRDVGNVRFAYVVLGSLVVGAGLLFMLAYLRRSTKLKVVEGDAGSTTRNVATDEEHPSSETAADRSLHGRHMNMRFAAYLVFLSFLFLFYHIFNYLERLPVSYFTSFAIKYLHWPVYNSSLVVSVFFGSHCLGRVVGVPVSTVLRPRTILLIDVTVTAIANLLLLTFVKVWPEVLWVSAALAGASVGTSFVAGILWVSETIPVSGRVASVITVGFSTASMIGPLVVGQLFDSHGPMCLIYVLAAMSLGYIALYVSMLLFVGRCRHRLGRLKVDVREVDGKEMTSLATRGDEEWKFN